MERNKIKKIVLAILSILVVAVLGSVFVNIGMEWFNSLNKPSQWIPNILIPIVWTCIYLIFAIVLSVWISRRGALPKSIVVLLVINGILNILWCLVFFTLRLTFIGNIVIILNLIMAYYLVLDIKKYNVTYFYFTAIYPIWISIATTLNTALWILN